jgi:hypothetical protein
MKNLLQLESEGFESADAVDINNWYREKGKFCSGCAEGKMKEHARMKSKKPLIAVKPR